MGEDRWLRRLALWFVPACALGAVPRTALGWGFDEHKRIGDEAFRRACEGADESQKRGLAQLLLPPGDAGAEGNLEGICSRMLFPGGRTYGVLTALSGDFVDSPYLLTDDPDHVDDQSGSLGVYLKLAHENYRHFLPHCRETYKSWHHVALTEAATSPIQDSAGDGSRRLVRALVINAFADHHLGDCFSAGHIRVDRKRLPDRLSDRLHAADNDANVKVRKLEECRLADSPEKGENYWKVSNGTESWCPVGDGHLAKVPASDPELERIIAANADSIRDVFAVALASGRPHDGAAAADAPAAGAQGTKDPQSRGAGRLLRVDATYPALSRMPRRPSCAEQTQVLGGSPCFSHWAYAETLSVGLGVEELMAWNYSAQTVTLEIGKPILSFLGVAVKADFWTRASQRTPEFTGASTWLPSVVPSVYVQSWPRRHTYTGMEWRYGVRVGMPFFIGPQLPDSWWERVKESPSGLPDASVFMTVLVYALDIRAELGWARFLAYEGPRDPVTGEAGWRTKRGGKLGVSAHYVF